MSAVVLNHIGRDVRPPSVVRILCNKCFEPNADHPRCPGVLQSKGVRFECTCSCHHTGPLFGGAQ